MGKYVFIAALVIIASYFRHKFNAIEMPWRERMLRGAVAGFAVGIVLVTFVYGQQVAVAREEVDVARLGWTFLLAICVGAISLLRGGPLDSPESFDFDDPENVTPGERVRKARQHKE
ncbi:hypothetical protein BST95_06705 [Halioglobus japonicus]|uniref:Uncharacterized protein n=1 Tax=Halioglobus japonicus TaxID=930805 RepID=A0AAP8SLY7_9GAMM|nr:hypothetical protein [Halioglobus japonicus]AQA17975.1 hypothetical protein BST95_06705 [Halioglobus japonicus]PLW84498.1 hypothetical protein C0029_18900 [Halioglobus japonicus]GHD24574.1 hypothetical protein GCM10007052_38220 [Halioglobus japonicus]